MLGTTARKLRILGFDTSYDAASEDRDLVKIALQSGRTLLTSDHDLYVYAKTMKANAILVRGTGEEERLFEVLTKSGVREIRVEGIVSRCSVCNGELIDTGTQKQTYGNVYSCKSCGKKYWRGSHWKKIMALFDGVNSRLRTFKGMG